MIEITAEVYEAMVGHALASRPDEACGLLTAAEHVSAIDGFHPMRNVAASSSQFLVDPQGMLDLERAAEAAGREVVAVMHSHVDTSAYPSATDVEDSARYDPDGHYRHLIVSLRHAEPAVRGFRLVRDTVVEEIVMIAEDTPVSHDGAGAAVAAVMQLPRPD